MLNQNVQPNIGNSIFTGFNDNQGLMLCGYEWGFSKNDQESSLINYQNRSGIPHVFSNKAVKYGEVANSWRYDNRIIYWFELFGHELIQKDLGGNFEKSILQTNWCDTQNHKMNGGYWEKLLHQNQVDNFIAHVEMFKPRLIFFFGSQIIKIMQSDKVMQRFIKTAGNITESLSFRTKEADSRIFNIGFQCFENCKIVCFPHPSGSRGLSDEYIKLFSPEVGDLIQEFKEFKRVL